MTQRLEPLSTLGEGHPRLSSLPIPPLALAPTLLLGLPGICLLGRRRAIFLYTTLALYLAFCWIDRLGNWFQVIMPAYALVVVGLAGACASRWVLLAPYQPPQTQPTISKLSRLSTE